MAITSIYPIKPECNQNQIVTDEMFDVLRKLDLYPLSLDYALKRMMINIQRGMFNHFIGDIATDTFIGLNEQMKGSK